MEGHDFFPKLHQLSPLKRNNYIVIWHHFVVGNGILLPIFTPNKIDKIMLGRGTSFLGGGNSNIFHFHPDPWGDDPILRIFFQMGGWFNHQLVIFVSPKEKGHAIEVVFFFPFQLSGRCLQHAERCKMPIWLPAIGCPGVILKWTHLCWSNYSDVTRVFTPKGS